MYVHGNRGGRAAEVARGVHAAPPVAIFYE